MSFFVHLILSAYVGPFVGCALLMLLGSALPFSQPFPHLPLEAKLFSAFIAPLLAWYIFVPLGCCTFFVFRLVATRPLQGLPVWTLLWCALGAASAVIFTNIADVGPSILPFVIIGFIAGGLLAPLHRSIWVQFYADVPP